MTYLPKSTHEAIYPGLIVTADWSLPFCPTKVAGSIKGKVVDVLNNLPLPDATITMMNKADSSNIGFAVADKTGAFEIKNIPAGAYLMGISFTGYAPFERSIDITATKSTFDLDTIKLHTDTTLMTSVIVTAPPITIKKDTVEFRASAFKTKPNATVEDLLKKLPGVEVDKDGNVTSQGENIPKIYVDGKEFFGNDPKLATKNLTAEMVESIQVFDDMSDQAKFTKIDDGSRQRTINIKLKKDRRKGLFGRTTVGAAAANVIPAT
ncbi:carboxypeptidase-like regulatory domain-containing protein [Paraflavitalea speifideaquila]|uniref:carboxypeptidase-like regulatory domain-containing protein n=1 Tax=Paraflavitalea speifideaquila TaxID=3076558 RepID=UPI0028E303D2|nr:carboxypeptidase-like regulatory domain-containing protein [Paraflavitalea speifideiaquila]